MKSGALGVLYAVNGPCAAELSEMFRGSRMPVTTLVNRISALEKLVNEFVQGRDDFVTLRHSERAARAKIILHVDDQ